MPNQVSVSLTNLWLIALAGLGLARACLISWSNARLQPPISPPAGVTREAALGLLFGQVAGAALAWMVMENTLRSMEISPVNYPSAMWHVSHGCMLFGAVAGLSAALGPRGLISTRSIFWSGAAALVAYGAQGAALMTGTTQTDTALLIAMLPAGMVTLLWTIRPVRPLVARRPFAVATIVLGGVCIVIGLAPLFEFVLGTRIGCALSRSSWPGRRRGR